MIKLVARGCPGAELRPATLKTLKLLVHGHSSHEGFAAGPGGAHWHAHCFALLSRSFHFNTFQLGFCAPPYSAPPPPGHVTIARLFFKRFFFRTNRYQLYLEVSPFIRFVVCCPDRFANSCWARIPRCRCKRCGGIIIFTCSVYVSQDEANALRGGSRGDASRRGRSATRR